MSPSEGRPAAEARQPPVPAGPSRGSRDPRGRGKGRERQGGDSGWGARGEGYRAQPRVLRGKSPHQGLPRPGAAPRSCNTPGAPQIHRSAAVCYK